MPRNVCMQCEGKVFVYKINVDDAEMCYDTVPISI